MMVVMNDGISTLGPAIETGWVVPFQSKSMAPSMSMHFSALLDSKGSVVSERELIFLVELLRQEDGGFVAHVPALPSASTQGASYEEALRMVTESIGGVLEVGAAEETMAKNPEYLAGPEDLVVSVRIPRNETA